EEAPVDPVDWRAGQSVDGGPAGDRAPRRQFGRHGLSVGQRVRRVETNALDDGRARLRPALEEAESVCIALFHAGVETAERTVGRDGRSPRGLAGQRLVPDPALDPTARWRK